MESRKEKAVRLFKEGYNCSQSVFAAYSDLFDIDEETAFRLSASFGGGMGRMREVCGAVSGMFLIAGLQTGAVEGKDREQKKHNYDVVQHMAEEYRKRNGSIVCKELLGLDKNSDTTNTTPEARTEQYYKKRPCVCLIEDAADIIEKFLSEERNMEKQRIDFVKVETNEQVAKTADLAEKIWHEHYENILSREQIDYMIDKFQSVPAIKRQMDQEDYRYYLIVIDGEEAGFIGIQPEEDALFLSKLYLGKNFRGMGYGRKAFEFLKKICGENGWKKIWLTVNKFNTGSIQVYEKLGFVKTRSLVTDIGNGFVMDDFIMEINNIDKNSGDAII